MPATVQWHELAAANVGVLAVRWALRCFAGDPQPPPRHGLDEYLCLTVIVGALY